MLNDLKRGDEYSSLLEGNKWANFFNSNRNIFGIKKSLYIVSNVYVINKYALILDSSKALISYLLHESFYWIPKFLKHPVISNPKSLSEELKEREEYFKVIVDREFNGSKKILELDAAVYLLHPFSWYAFGHLNDSLLRLKALENISLDKNLPFLISNPKRIIGFEEHLKIILGYTPKLIEMTNFSDVVKVKNLLVPISNSVYTSFTKEDYIWMREKYLNYFDLKIKKTSYRLYLSRNHISVGKRSVINEDEVLELLEKYNFITLTGGESLPKIVDYFYNADLVVGYHGSLFANLFFSRCECRVLEFCAKNREDHSFEKKFKLVKDYQQILVDADENFNTKIDLKILENYLNN